MAETTANTAREAWKAALAEAEKAWNASVAAEEAFTKADEGRTQAGEVEEAAWRAVKTTWEVWKAKEAEAEEVFNEEATKALLADYRKRHIGGE